MENPAYRDNLEMLYERFPDKPILTLKDVSDWMGRDPRTVKKLYGVGRGGISVATLARKLS